MRKKVYIAGPIVVGDLAHNIKQGVDALHSLMRAGYAPFCPHLSCYAGEVQKREDGTPYVEALVSPGNHEVQVWYESDMPWVDASDALLRLPGYGKGSDAEVAYALANNIPVFYNLDDLYAQLPA